MPMITPHLWFDRQAEEAARLYVSLFQDARIGHVTRYGKAGFEVHGQREGTAMTVEFELAGQRFVAINGGPHFKFNPSVSFFVACKTKDEVDTMWSVLCKDGSVMMELGSYPFSDWYGWVADRYGLSWQLMYMGSRPFRQKITPTLMFVGEQSGNAEKAINQYLSIFKGSRVTDTLRWGKDEQPELEGTIKRAAFTLAGYDFAAMDSALGHKFAFNEAISFMVPCETQEEIDFYWNNLSQGGDEKAQQCGWLKDRFGVSWQVSPTILKALLNDHDPARVERVTNTFLKMKKFDIAALRRAAEGK